MAYILILLCMMKTINALLLILFATLSTFAQNIKSIQLKPAGNDKSYIPVVRLGSVLELSFDDLDGDSKDYQYKIEQMTYDWKPSRLQSSQYIRGFNQNYFNDMTNSFNTLQGYTHYKVRLPNQNTSITKSGNYIISVLDDYDEVIFTRRCVFYETAATVGVGVFRSRNTFTQNEQQTVQLRVNHEGIPIVSPSQEIKVMILKNNDWNITIDNIEPLFIKPNQLIYNHTQKTNFWAGNEFLNFDNKYIRNNSVDIARVEKREVYHNYLYTDDKRGGVPYRYNPDINGQYVIRTLENNTDDPDSEADYAMIHFSLDSYEPIPNKDVYVYGGFNNFKLTDETKMTYNAEQEMYEASLLLKQGFYNYSYVTVDDNNIANLTEIDGSFYETENEYTAIIYYKPFGSMYDRVIGVGFGFFDQNR